LLLHAWEKFIQVILSLGWRLRSMHGCADNSMLQMKHKPFKRVCYGHH